MHVQEQLDEKNFVCEYCGKSYFKKKNRNQHVKLVHEQEKKFICSVCDFAFPKKSYLVVHERTHSGEKPHQCEICPNSFARADALKYHQIHVHGIDVTFKCDECPKIFHRKDQLTAHVKTHSELDLCNEISDTMTVKKKKKKTKSEGKIEKWSHSFKEEAVKMARETSFEESCSKNNITRYVLGRWIKLIENPITCEVCSKSFAHRSKFRKHMLTHFPENIVCEFCSKTFGNRAFFEKHMKSQCHQNSIPQVIDSKPDLRDLYLKKFSTGEEIKDDVESKEMMIDENMVKVEINPDVPYESNDYESYSKMVNSERENAGTNDTQMCFDDSKIGELETNVKKEESDSELENEEKDTKETILETSIANDLGEKTKTGVFVQEQQQPNAKNFACGYCYKTYFKKKNRNEHVKLVHDLEKKFMCSVCEMKFPKKSYLIIHERIHTGEKPHQCELCQKSFARTGSLKYHKKAVHGIGITLSFQCDQCSKRFHRKDQLTTHIRTHSESHVCKICGKEFNIKQSWQKHMQSHLGIKACQCVDCGKMFSSERCLKDHVAIIHNQEIRDKFQCDDCGIQFRRKKSLKEHVAIKHLGHKGFPCPECGKSFTRITSLKIHKLTHTNGIPYSCKFCSQGYTQERNLMKHMEKQHSYTGTYNKEQMNTNHESESTEQLINRRYLEFRNEKANLAEKLGSVSGIPPFFSFK
eukprot:GFUD01024013.1.p1 GENE.GFUD01024013.1~~GFUD01024013.1.p1  ORF type:complete len:697 (-),score=90.84 GFUD01024013.1:60-2150(-)